MLSFSQPQPESLKLHVRCTPKQKEGQEPPSEYTVGKLEIKGPATFGRSHGEEPPMFVMTGNQHHQIVLDDSTLDFISGCHFMLVPPKILGNWTVFNTGSTTGLFINNSFVAEDQQINDGDSIQIRNNVGSKVAVLCITFTVHFGSDGPKPPAVLDQVTNGSSSAQSVCLPSPRMTTTFA